MSDTRKLGAVLIALSFGLAACGSEEYDPAGAV